MRITNIHFGNLYSTDPQGWTGTVSLSDRSLSCHIQLTSDDILSTLTFLKDRLESRIRAKAPEIAEAKLDLPLLPRSSDIVQG